MAKALRIQNPDYERAVRDSFKKQTFMATLGAKLVFVAPGEVRIALPFSSALKQQHGFLHAGAVATIADSACGYAALTLMPPGYEVVSSEFKINLMAPAVGENFLSRGRVVRAGKSSFICVADVFDQPEDFDAEPIALMQATMIARRY